MPWRIDGWGGDPPPVICFELRKQAFLFDTRWHHRSSVSAADSSVRPIATWKGPKMSFSFYFVLLRVNAELHWGIGLFCNNDSTPSEVIYIFGNRKSRKKRLRSHDEEPPRRKSWLRWSGSLTTWAKAKAKLLGTLWSGEPHPLDRLHWCTCTWPCAPLEIKLPCNDNHWIESIDHTVVMPLVLEAFRQANSEHPKATNVLEANVLLRRGQKTRARYFSSRVSAKVYPRASSLP